MGGIRTLFAAAALLTTVDCSSHVPAIEPEDLASTWIPDSSFVLVDVRTQAEWEDTTGHLQDATLLPLQDLEAHPEAADQFIGKTVVVYCRSGSRSSRATSMLRDRGITAYNLTGGIRKWRAEGRPVVVERPAAEHP